MNNIEARRRHAIGGLAIWGAKFFFQNEAGVDEKPG
jgi:hypothetical protein